MPISAGVELVWNLAARETVLGRWKEIEPEHLLMAVLKFAEAEEEALRSMVGDPLAAKAMLAERDQVRALLAQGAVRSTEARRALRQVLGQGGFEHTDGVIHRSAAARSLFERAAALVPAERPLEVVHLLRALLAEPTPAMRTVLGLREGQTYAQMTPLLERYGRALHRPGQDGQPLLPEACAPQVQALSALLELDEPTPRLLIYDPRLPVEGLLAQAAHTLGERWHLWSLAGDRLVADSAERQDLDARLSELWSQAAQNEACGLLIELAPLAATPEAWALRALCSALEQAPAHTFLAIALDAYPAALAADARLKSLCRAVWLHDLSQRDQEGRTALVLPGDTYLLGERVWQLLLTAREDALLRGLSQVPLVALLAAIGQHPEARVLLARSLGLSTHLLQERYPLLRAEATLDPRQLPPTAEVRQVMAAAQRLACQVADLEHPGQITVRHVVCALALQPAVSALLEVHPIPEARAGALLVAWSQGDLDTPPLGELTQQMRAMRASLLSRVYGQDHAVHVFVEGLFNAQILAQADAERKGPRAVFVFVGPPGVGKTYLAELCASYLGRPFRRFDMSAYADHQQHVQLVGFAPSYQAAQAGSLTGWVGQNPDAILLFDEIEKAHTNTIQLFLQILDTGRLEDKFTGKEVSFRDTVIIFTTNAGASLYDRPNATGISISNATYHRHTILDALRSEKGPYGEVLFPPAICSRLAAGYPVLFNRLGINELDRVARGELERVGGMIEQQYYKSISFDEPVPLALVLHEGAQADARSVRSQSGVFLRTELWKFLGLYERQRLDQVLADVGQMHLSLELDAQTPASVRAVFEPATTLKVLLLAGAGLADLFRAHIQEVQWLTASNLQDALDLLSSEEVEYVLLDIWLGRTGRASDEALPTDGQFDHVPSGAQALSAGQECLRVLHERLPGLPVYLLSLAQEEMSQGSVDEELLVACMRSGGARGVLSTAFGDSVAPGWPQRRDGLARSLGQTALRMYRERQAQALGRERQVLAFDSAPSLDQVTGRVNIRLRNLRLTRAVAAEDVSEVLEQVERPSARMADVIGAEVAKEALTFVVDWLRHPRQYAVRGVRPPKGFLLTGQPGTGKTMLARALAGESEAAFLVASGTDFVTVWQGSGPQNIRNLFARARRYAPAIVFIDEVDAIGRARTGTPGGGRAEENTLNALLTEMDGFAAPLLRPVIVITATNVPEQLDEALLRRFDRVLEVPLPDRAARREYLRRELLARKGAQVSEGLVEDLAARSAGMTIADLRRVADEAAVMAARRAATLTDAVLSEAFEKLRMGEATPVADAATLERIARHEAGHALVAHLLGKPLVQASIVGRSTAGGYVEREAEEGKLLFTRREAEAVICQAMAGRAAELLYYGEDGLSSGAASDLKTATLWAERMVREFGMSDRVGQVYLDPHLMRDGPLAARVSEVVEQIVHAQLDGAVQHLQAHQATLERLARELLARNRLLRADLEAILQGVK